MAMLASLTLTEADNVGVIDLGKSIKLSSSSAYAYYLSYAIWSDANVEVYVTDGSDCSTTNKPTRFFTACSRETARRGFLPQCTQYSATKPVCLFIYCASASGCGVSYNVEYNRDDPGSSFKLPYILSETSTPSQTPSPSTTTTLTATPSTTSTLTASSTKTPSQTPTISVTSTLTLTASPTPTGSLTSTCTPSGSQTPSNTPLATPSPGSAVLRLSLVFSGSSGAFTPAMQGTIITSAAATLSVPRASIGWLGVTNPSAPGISRLLQAGARVQLSLLPAAAASSPVIQASMASGSSLSAAVTSALSTGFNAALASQPDAAPLATALGYTTTAAMLTSLSLDSSIPIAAVVMSATPSPSPRYGTTLSAAETGGLVGGILGGSALALYFITVTIVACCVRCACCCQHAQCKERYRTRSIWCCCCTVTPPPPSKDAAAPGMVMRSAAV